MVLLEVPMPSGFIIDTDKLAGLLHVAHIKRIETKRGETQANIYIDQMVAEEELCVTVHGYRSHQVAETKPVAVKIYDYYDSCKLLLFCCCCVSTLVFHHFIFTDIQCIFFSLFFIFSPPIAIAL